MLHPCPAGKLLGLGLAMGRGVAKGPGGTLPWVLNLEGVAMELDTSGQHCGNLGIYYVCHHFER